MLAGCLIMDDERGLLMQHTKSNFEPHTSKWLTTKEIVELTGIPRSTIYRWSRQLQPDQVTSTDGEIKIHFQAIYDKLHEKVCPECNTVFFTFRENKEFCERKHMHRYSFRKWKKAQ
jgi:hypothetical protein